jgi:hypothetical protein
MMYVPPYFYYGIRSATSHLSCYMVSMVPLTPYHGSSPDEVKVNELSHAININ